MRMPGRGAILGIVVFLGLAGCASQQATQPTGTLGALLDGAQMVPPIQSSGKGALLATLDHNGILNWDLNYSQLSGPATSIRFRGPAAAGLNAGVLIDVPQTQLASPLRGVAQLNQAQIADLIGDRWYIVIATTAHPEGEIRGQIEFAK